MGATAHLKAVSQNLIELFLAEPRLVEPFLCGLPPSLPPGLPAEFREQVLKSINNPDRMQELEADIAAIRPDRTEAILAEADEPDLNLDKNWEELTSCIAGDDSRQSPLGRCINGGTAVGPNLGYGPARFLSYREVVETSVALEAVDADLFGRRAQGIGLPADYTEFLLALFVELRQYYRQAVNEKKGMLLSLA